MDSFEECQRREAEELAQARDLIQAGLLHGQPSEACGHALICGLSEEVPNMLYRAWVEGRLDHERLRLALPEVWIKNRAPMPCLGQRRWIALFKAAGFLSRTETVVGQDSAYEVEYHAEPPAPASTLTAWRGAALEGGGRGLSWTSHRDCAMSFAQGAANRLGRAGLYRAEIPGRAVLAIFGDWREQEIVVNPDYLRRRIELIDEVEETEKSRERRQRLQAIFSTID